PGVPYPDRVRHRPRLRPDTPAAVAAQLREQRRDGHPDRAVPGTGGHAHLLPPDRRPRQRAVHPDRPGGRHRRRAPLPPHDPPRGAAPPAPPPRPGAPARATPPPRPGPPQPGPAGPPPRAGPRRIRSGGAPAGHPAGPRPRHATTAQHPLTRGSAPPGWPADV